MARFRVIVLDQPDARSYRVALWADVPVAVQPLYADPALTSAWKDATIADLTALRNGSVTETITSLSLDEDMGQAGVRTRLEAMWAEFQQHVTQRNPLRRYGTTWDGATWSAP